MDMYVSGPLSRSEESTDHQLLDVENLNKVGTATLVNVYVVIVLLSR